MPDPLELAIRGFFHRAFKGHQPEYVWLEVILRGRQHGQLECLNCDRRPGPSSRIPIPVPFA